MDTEAVIKSFQTQTVSFSTLGFTFAAALAWMNFIQWTVAHFLKDAKGTSGRSLLITALVTSIIAVAIILLIQFIQRSTLDLIISKSERERYQSR